MLMLDNLAFTSDPSELLDRMYGSKGFGVVSLFTNSNHPKWVFKFQIVVAWYQTTTKIKFGISR